MSDVEAAVVPGEAAHDVGTRLRNLRTQQGMSARALADALGISPSAVSQIERGVLQPSVSRLIAITDALSVPLAAVFEEDAAPAADGAGSGFAVQRADSASSVTLDSGVTFCRLSPGPTPGVEYFESTYPPGATAHTETQLFRHVGYEVGTMISGELTVDFATERVILRPGDAISFPSSHPHRIHNTGSEDAVARWLIVHSAR